MNSIRDFLIITWNKYPEEDAGAVRQHAFAKNLSDLGFKPIIIGMGSSTEFDFKEYDGITYASLRYKSNYILFRVLGRLLFSRNLHRILKRLEKDNLAGILLVSGDYNTFRYVKKYSRNNKIQLYHDSVEWYSACEFSRGERDFAYKFNNAINTKIIDSNFRVFSISRYLEEHFSGKGIKSVRVPVILDVSRIDCCKKNTDKKIHFLYAGSIAGKDRLEEFINAISYLDSTIKEKVIFDVLGCTYDQYKSVYGCIDDSILDKHVFFRGRVTREEVMRFLKNADFTILFRLSNERYARAGFPTKVVESLATGTPVLCNLSSDLELYLNDGFNSVIVDKLDPICCADAIRRICSYDPMIIDEMKMNARHTAERYFDRRVYLNAFKDLLFND